VPAFSDAVVIAVTAQRVQTMANYRRSAAPAAVARLGRANPFADASGRTDGIRYDILGVWVAAFLLSVGFWVGTIRFLLWVSS
jgi:hypothetical protein